jgi:hypothetical protein
MAFTAQAIAANPAIVGCSPVRTVEPDKYFRLTP